MKDFNIVTASVTGCTEAFYIDPRTCHAYIDPSKALNADRVNLDGVNHVCIDADASGNFVIFQASGYTTERGLFLDVYPTV